MRMTQEDRIFDIVLYCILGTLSIIITYPLYFVVIASLSSPTAVNTGQVILNIKGFTLEGYRQMFEDDSIWTGYKNTLLYTFSGTSLNVILTLLAGYALSRKDLPGRRIIMAYFIITMYFNGGLIPTYMLINQLELVNKPVIMVLLGAVSVFNIIITRTYFSETIQQELLEAANMDGCGNLKFFISIVLPLSKAITAVLVVYYGVSHWNQYFNALIYLNEKKYYPLQLILREILLMNKQLETVMDESTAKMIAEREQYAQLIKYCIIIVSSLPVLLMYPFAQKYFVKGVMIGSVKG